MQLQTGELQPCGWKEQITKGVRVVGVSTWQILGPTISHSSKSKQAVCYHPVENSNSLSILNLNVPFQGTFKMGEGLQAQMQNQRHMTKYISTKDNTLCEQIYTFLSKTYSCSSSNL